jgi:hypothetical protein
VWKKQLIWLHDRSHISMMMHAGWSTLLRNQTVVQPGAKLMSKAMRRSLSALAVLGLTLTVSFGAGGVARGDVVIASNLAASPSYSSFDYGIGFAGSTSNGPFTNETPAQEFTAGTSATIHTITATVGQFQPQGVPLTVLVTTAAGSIPGATLGSVTFATGQVSSNAFTSPTTFDMSSAGINLTAGQHYFVEFFVATPINGSIRYQALLLNTPNPIAFGFPAIDSPNGGSTWLPPAVPNEIGLTISGTPISVPEPSPLTLACAGGVLSVALAAWRRRGR